MNIMRPFCLLALILTSLSAHANQFTIDYASLATGSQSTRTDVVPLSSPYTIDLGNGDETITEVTVTTTAVNQDFTNAGDGLSVVGGTSDANFESEEQIHLSFSIETTLGNPVTDMDIDFLGASARAVDGDVITFSTGGDSATVTWPINTNSPGTAGLLSSIKLAFSPLQTLQVTAGPLSAAQQRTQLSSLTFELNPPRPPNVIVVLVDDLGWTDVEQDPELFPDGSPLYETPNMHRLAEEGLRFTQAYAQPLCSASRAALLSGQYSAARDFLYLAIVDRSVPNPVLPTTSSASQAYNYPEDRDHLPLSLETIAERMKAAGYATWHAGKWHLGNSNYYPDKHGFDKQLGVGGSGPGSYFGPFNGIPNLVDAFGNEAKGNPGDHVGEHYARLVKELLEDHLSNQPDTPFFFHYTPFSVHSPHEAKQSRFNYYADKLATLTNSKHVHPLFAAKVEALDDELGALLDCMDANNLNNNTILFFLSDNGGLSIDRQSGNVYDDIGPDGIPDTPGNVDGTYKSSRANVSSDTLITNMAPMRAGKGALYEGGIRVPLMVRYPKGSIPAGVATNEVVHLVDIYQTILDLTPAVPKPGYTLDGISLKPVLKQTSNLPDRDLFIFFPRFNTTWGTRFTDTVYPGGTAVINHPYKMIARYSLAHDAAVERYELYHLDNDLGESVDIAAQNPELVDEMRKRLDAWYIETNAPFPTRNPAYNGTALDDPEITYKQYLNQTPLAPNTPESFKLSDPDADGRNNFTEFLQQTDPSTADAPATNFWLFDNGSFEEMRLALPAEAHQTSFDVYDAGGQLISLSSDWELDAQYGDFFVYRPKTAAATGDLSGFSIAYTAPTFTGETEAEFTIDYTTLLGNATSSQTDTIALSEPIAISALQDMIGSVSVTTQSIGGQTFSNAGNHGLAVAGGLNSLWFDSEEQFSIQFALTTVGGSIVENVTLELIEVGARAPDSERVTFTSASGSTFATWPINTNSNSVPGTLDSTLDFAVNETLTVQTGTANGSLQRTQLSYLTFKVTAPEGGGPVLVDTDSDLLPDSYEEDNGLSPIDPSDGQADNDRDGYSRGQEYLFGYS